MASLGIALVAIGIAIGAWFRPMPKYEPPAPPTYSSQQVADAKAKVCAAYERVDHAVLANTARSGDNDSSTQLALAANARIALFDGGEYLLKVVGQEPATPTDLAVAARALADSYQELAMDYLAEANDTKIQTSRKAIEAGGSRIDKVCA
ncbi:MAG: hypothetical protein K2X97_01310 [Mycobacteriaceae bacterium]|nr:hypothetical protein [Mycobacteriaceae bacterium]